MNKVKNIYKHITRDRWEIGFVEGGLDAVMGQDPLKVNWLEHGYKDRWFADPFVLDVTDSEIHVLVEEYRYATEKGRIALLVVDKLTYRLKSLEIVLEETTHLSFPAIRRKNGKVFVYPESWQSGALSSYEYRDGCCDPASKRVLCEEAIADAVITERFGAMMLFAVQKNDKLRVYRYDTQTERFAFSFEKPFGKATARNAGDFFEYKGEVYRPAQVCVDHYGEALEIQKVVCDDDNNFCFIPYKTLYSSHGSLDTGMHTLNSFKGVTVIDVHGWNNRLTVKSVVSLKKVFLGCVPIRKEVSVMVDKNCDVVYSSFYLHALSQLFGKQNVRFERWDDSLSDPDVLSFIIRRKGGGVGRYVISLADSYRVNEELYHWCDVYGSVNANLAKTPEQFHRKLVPLCPSFGVRPWNLFQMSWIALQMGRNPKLTLRKQLGRYKRLLERPAYGDYYPHQPDDHYVFFLSTLWYHDEWNQNDTGLNTRRANFIRACKQLGDVRFEGGLVSQGMQRSSEDLFADCLAKAVPMREWMEKTKRSALVFNTPAFWDCHGWKLGEYLAMGKCIVSTALSNDLPAPLEHGVHIHYVDNTLEAMKEAVKYILNHPEYAAQLERGAKEYWERYGSPTASLRLLGIEK